MVAWQVARVLYLDVVMLLHLIDISVQRIYGDPAMSYMSLFATESFSAVKIPCFLFHDVSLHVHYFNFT